MISNELVKLFIINKFFFAFLVAIQNWDKLHELARVYDAKKIVVKL
jgi:hypothetical protein